MQPTNNGKPYYCRSYRLKPSIVDKLKRLSETTGLSQTDCVSQAILLMVRVEARRAVRDRSYGQDD